MFKLTLVTPEKKIVADQELDEVTVPAFKGELNILEGHAPLMTTLEPGILKYKLKGFGTAEELAIGWGYCQVSSEGVNILAESAMAASDIDVAVVKQLLQKEETKLTTESLDDAQWEHTQHEINRLKAEIELAAH